MSEIIKVIINSTTIHFDQNMMQTALLDYAKRLAPEETKNGLHNISWSMSQPWNAVLYFEKSK